MVCELCSCNGRIRDQCFKVIGYPIDWPKTKRKKGGQYAHQVGYVAPSSNHVTEYSTDFKSTSDQVSQSRVSSTVQHFTKE